MHTFTEWIALPHPDQNGASLLPPTAIFRTSRNPESKKSWRRKEYMPSYFEDACGNTVQIKI
jgi:hypothetical protein